MQPGSTREAVCKLPKQTQPCEIYTPCDLERTLSHTFTLRIPYFNTVSDYGMRPAVDVKIVARRLLWPCQAVPPA